MDCFYTVSAKVHSETAAPLVAHTLTGSANSRHYARITAALYQRFFVVEVKGAAQLPQNLSRGKSLVRNHKQET